MTKENENIQVDVKPTLEEIQKENQNLFSQLTNKNSEYITKLTRHLVVGEMSDVNRENQLNTMMKTMLSEQDKGTTGRQLYGTVTDQADYILNGPIEQLSTSEEDIEWPENWKLWLDGGLLFGGIFSFVQGVSQYFSETAAANTTGLVSLLVNFIAGGLVMLALTKSAPRQGQKGGFGKYFLVSFVAILFWFVISAAAQSFVPQSINIALSPTFLIVIGAVTLALRYYLKKKLDIHTTLF